MEGDFGGEVNVDVVDAGDDSQTGNTFEDGSCWL